MDIEKIKEIRQKTNLSLAECKKALEKAGGCVDDAIILLQGYQKKKTDKRKNMDTTEGRIHAYVHNGSQIGCILEVNCETDFAARSELFVKFCEDIALQIVAMQPMYISRNEISLEQEVSQRKVIETNLSDFLSDKSDEVREDVLDQRIKNWYREVALMEQTSVIDQSKTISDMLEALSAQLGEKVKISRFERWVVGN